ncbi:exported hypothetical protein [Cupriavidus taiwanensis]|nr:exported hypothetical protein [Cupriavidus taiwanensis]SOZ97283.1 exported hypothetical protein [Cupriavidus taiwanensis]
MLFQVVGSATASLISGAVVSTGCNDASTRQYSGIDPIPVPLAGISVAAVTCPPVVGSPIAEAGIWIPAKLSHELVDFVAVSGGGESEPPPHPLNAAMKTHPALDRIVRRSVIREKGLVLTGDIALYSSYFGLGGLFL